MTPPPVFRAQSLEGASLRHGFFGRKGGVSTGVYASLNTGKGSEDDTKHVTENRERIANTMDVPTDHLVGIHQVHCAQAICVDRPWPGAIPKADALVTATPGLALSILTADCAPVLLADPDARIIGAAHAGWRGALAGILESTVDAMVEIGAKANTIRAAIGPCIAQSSYEVGPEFLETFVMANSAHELFFSRGKDDRWHFNLEYFCTHRLRNRGIETIEAMAMDTCARSSDFFSYRRATQRGESDYGRNLGAIMLCKTG